MAELKTLKDLDLHSNKMLEKHQKGLLKQEASKWIKSLEYSHMHYNKKERMTVEERDFLIEWIEYFFNLTEEGKDE